MTKDELRLKVRDHYIQSGGFDAAYNATGTGKSAAAIECIRAFRFVFKNRKPVLVVCHSTSARDYDWPEQMNLWGDKTADFIGDGIFYCCYKSLPNMIKKRDWGMVILDEGHYITEYSASFFEYQQVDSVLVLTATRPEENEKLEILDRLTKGNYGEYAIDTAIEDGVLNDYELHILYIELDDTDAYVKMPRARKRYTERKAYDIFIQQSENYKQTLQTRREELLSFIRINSIEADEDSWSSIFKSCMKFCREVMESMPKEAQQHYRNNTYFHIRICIESIINCFKLSKQLTRDRMHFIYNLKSKVECANYVHQNLRRHNRRFISFCSNKAQCDAVSPYAYYTGRSSEDYKRFRAGEINELAACKKIQEGGNFSNLDAGVCVQLTSKPRALVQRAGRFLRREIGYISKIWIIVAKDTQDEVWLQNAIKKQDQAKIHYHHYRRGTL